MNSKNIRTCCSDDDKSGPAMPTVSRPREKADGRSGWIGWSFNSINGFSFERETGTLVKIDEGYGFQKTNGVWLWQIVTMDGLINYYVFEEYIIGERI